MIAALNGFAVKQLVRVFFQRRHFLHRLSQNVPGDIGKGDSFGVYIYIYITVMKIILGRTREKESNSLPPKKKAAILSP